METETPNLDLSGHGLTNTEMITRIYTHLFEQHSTVTQGMWDALAQFDAIKRDMRAMDVMIQELRERGETEEVIYKTIIDRVYGRNTH